VAWIKTPPEVAAAFDAAAPRDPAVVRKPMFGYPALYLGGNMFAGTFQDKIVARLGEADRAAALRAGAEQFAPMPGRPMKEYIVVPAADVARPAALKRWLARAQAHAATLPPKAPTAKAAGPSRAARPAGTKPTAKRPPRGR
jgi:TfoX/Sxy family transcriptional regulator of competence genes